jgi:DNA modification methylase
MANNSNNKKRAEYEVKTVADAKSIATQHLVELSLDKALKFGLPEIDDRYHYWRVPLKASKEMVGEIVIDARSKKILTTKTTRKKVLESRISTHEEKKAEKPKTSTSAPVISPLTNTVALGDSEELLRNTPSGSVNLVFTSPPYYNARPEYADYHTYEEYLAKMKRIIHEAHRALSEGRFFVMNISPVLIRRASRSEASKRIAVPFDMHALFIAEGFEFVDDIIWVKPSGAGWATGRGRRFAADRNPLQYKAVPVTEYVLVYRKESKRLIDWSIRKHPDQEAVKSSKIEDGYETTNIWKLGPAHSKKHPAIFPDELAEKVIRYYSFKGDVVLDPFGGIGTVGKVASALDRRFVLYELDEKYMSVIRQNISSWKIKNLADINWINCDPPAQTDLDFK